VVCVEVLPKVIWQGSLPKVVKSGIVGNIIVVNCGVWWEKGVLWYIISANKVPMRCWEPSRLHGQIKKTQKLYQKMKRDIMSSHFLPPN
jgi:hypothetical protein